MKVSAYGRQLTIMRGDGVWRVFETGVDGKRRLSQDIHIPEETGPEEIVQYLGDLLHEYATERNPSVVLLE